jgi:hypothetical protein
MECAAATPFGRATLDVWDYAARATIGQVEFSDTVIILAYWQTSFGNVYYDHFKLAFGKLETKQIGPGTPALKPAAFRLVPTAAPR